MTRHKARESAFALVFETLISDIPLSQQIEAVRQTEALALDDYTITLAEGVVQKREELDEKIEPFLRRWSLARLSRVSLAILEIAFYEILYVDEVDAPVAINEAVELAKAYADDGAPAFINGVLASLLREETP